MAESVLEAFEVRALVEAEEMVKAESQESTVDVASFPLETLTRNPRTEDTVGGEQEGPEETHYYPLSTTSPYNTPTSYPTWFSEGWC